MKAQSTIADFERLEQQLQIKQMQVNSLLEVTQAINYNLPGEKLFRIFEFILRAQIQVQKLVVYIKSDQFFKICSYGVPEENSQLKKEILIPQLLEYNKLTIFENRDESPFPGLDIIIPVFHKNQPLAFALLETPPVGKFETLDEKLKFIQTITNIIVVAVENKRLFKKQMQQEVMQRELELAAQVQSMLIPDKLPNNKQIEMAAVYQPHRDVGGDYYDYYKKSSNEIIFCIGDISGKGIGAALLMANFQATLRTLVKKFTNLEDFIISLNDTVTDITKGEKFITLFLGYYNTSTRTLEYINAGHNPPLLINGDKIEELEIGCTILGIFHKLPFINTGKVQITPNSILVSYTDGLTDLENEDGENYRMEDLAEFIRTNQNCNMERLNHLILNEIKKFKGANDFIDDISILSGRFR